MLADVSASDEMVCGASARSDRADPYLSYRFVGAAFALIIVAASLFELWRNAMQPSGRDFLGVWAAGKLALGGHAAAAYDMSSLSAVESAAATFGSASAQLPFPYPPAYLTLASGFAWIPFPAAMAGWVAITFAFYLFASRRLVPQAGWLAAAFPAVFTNAAIGQNGFLTAGLFMAGLALLETSPFAAGLVLGCLVLKPQLALLLPVAMIAGRHWRTIAGAFVSATGLMGLGLVLFGPAATAAWLQQAPLIVHVTGEGLMGWSKLASVYAASREAGLPVGAALAVHGAAAVVAGALVWRVWNSPADKNVKISMLAAGSMLMSPYVFFYDGLILVPAFFCVAGAVERPAFVAALWCVLLLIVAQAAADPTPANLNPLVAVALMVLTYAIWRGRQRTAADASLTFRQPSGVRISQRVKA